MTKEDWIWWQNFRDNLRGTLTNDEYLKVSQLHANYFDHKVNYPCKCSPRIIQSYIDDLNDFWSNNPKPRSR